MNRLLLCCLLAACLGSPGAALASNARDYVPVPAGTNIINLYYNHYFGNELYVRDKKVSNSANYTGNISILRPIHYMMLGPFLIDPQAIIPFGEVELNGERSSGLGDITILSTIWLINNEEHKFFFAYTPYLTLPTGPYRKDSAINLGANRWSTKQEICFGKGFGDKTWFEWVINAEFFTNNTNAPGEDDRKVTASKDPVFGTEAHLSYSLTKDFFVSADYYFAYGGETTLDGIRQNDRKSTHTIGTSFAYMLTSQLQLMLDYQHDLGVQNGIRTNKFAARLAYVF